VTIMTVMTSCSHDRLKAYAAIAQRIRINSITSTTSAGSGHATSSLSCADLLATLFFHSLRFDVQCPQACYNDRFVLSKGHATPAFWSVLTEAGAYGPEQLQHMRRFDSELEGHPTTRSPYVDAPTGSLGQGLSIALGMALTARHRGIDNRIWVLLGDGELAEGSNWEAANLASYYKTRHLIAVVDANRLGQTGVTMFGHDLNAYAQRFEAFGWRSRIIDGHDIASIVEAYDWAQEPEDDRPTVIIARTVKGKGVSFLEDADNRHGKPVSGEEYERALADLGAMPGPQELSVAEPERIEPSVWSVDQSPLPDPDYQGEEATRTAYGDALKQLLDQDDRILVFDSEVSNSTKSGVVAEQHVDRFIECFIAEQNMIGMAVGSTALGAVPFCSSFAAFLTRAADQIRMAGHAGCRLICAGSHAGVSIGEDGPSQMGLEDMALFRAMHGATVLCPADAVSAYRLVEAASREMGLVYLRLARPKTPVLYQPDDQNFRIGGSRVLRGGPGDVATIVACGVCVAEALSAAAQLATAGIPVRVVDAYSIQPLDVGGIASALVETPALICVEDHAPAGGLGEAVASQVLGRVAVQRYQHLAVAGEPRSGTSQELMVAHGIDTTAIVQAVKAMTSGM